MSFTIKQLKELIEKLPNNMEIRGANHFPGGEELDEYNFKVRESYLLIEYYAPESPD